ncbi:hypothetical protein HS088_TW23G00729 [Tripterygium wilfordii]|uniref:Uncharacterized protein n=1 Tax=Tripterygium wilfordii TaxID=458696 RepID=A0A7J7BVT0_TRIWF|nr:uncharacterized protein LOC119993850 [Tripterygium wilfordii]KAF5725992.1 hypothetical protein HS088_TW23G00729 [Tripterygium wilfordii]
MLLRTSISNTKRFFQRTIESVKSLFSCAKYQKLPKSKNYPHNNPYRPHPYVTVRGAGMIDNVQTTSKFNDLDNFYANYTKGGNKKKKKEKTSAVTPVKRNHNQKQSRIYGISEGRSCLVAEKLKELEMIDKSNVDHLLDIEEVVHYYSRLTCPAYLDIVDTFFFDMCSEFFTSK